jgi:hypothetical protein
MQDRPISEELFEHLCSLHRIPCIRIETGSRRTPDFELTLDGHRVICEVKQIDPNREDLDDAKIRGSGDVEGRIVPNRLRTKLKNVSGQLTNTARSGQPTILVVYDNTPLKMYCEHVDVLEAMFGHDSVAISWPTDSSEPLVSKPFFGANKGLTPNQNTSVSVLAILDGRPGSDLSLRVYHNPHARVVLQPDLLGALPVSEELLPSIHGERWTNATT